jgi:DNA polymerase-3 subunit alpha
MWASATLEDLAGGVEVLYFPTTYELFADRIADDLVVAIKGKINRRDGGSLSVVVSDMAILDVAESAAGRPVVLQLKETFITDDRMGRLREVLETHRGKIEVHVRVGRQLLRLTDYRVEVTPALLADLKALIGAGNVTV